MWALSSPQVLHSAVLSSFQPNPVQLRKRILWRTDHLGDSCYLLVLSEVQPDFTHISKQFGDPLADWAWETKKYSTLLDRLKTGQVWRFRLRANPVHSSSREKDESTGRGKIFAHVTTQQQKQWLMDRSQAHGFSLAEDTFDIVNSEYKKFYKSQENNREVILRTADYEGTLTILNVESFTDALLSGIGRAKAYGCGLLTVAGYQGGGNG